MKHQSIWLAALLLGGMPLCAMALDYGPASPLLAAEAGAQRLPMPTAGGTAANDTAGDVGAMEDEADSGPVAAASSAQHVAPSGASPQPAVSPRSSGTARRTIPIQPAAHPEAPAATTSWQSLLPGSIQ